MAKALFMKDVSELKAWELYTGQSLWFVFIGIVFFLLKYLLDLTFLSQSSRFQSAYRVVEKIGTGQGLPEDGRDLVRASGVL
tara:strand:+ start:146 stop:391 length:246 start_codon:yes stop_codon:yes gene_type:complete